MVIDSGNYICEKCGQEIDWILADSAYESSNIKGCIDNGMKIIASIRCPYCGYAQSNSLSYDSKKIKLL